MRLQDMQEKKLSLHIKHLLSELFYPSQSIFLVQVCLIFFLQKKSRPTGRITRLKAFT